MARDLRRYARQTSIRLFAGFLLILFGVGIGLIYVIYGQGAAAMGLLCLTLGLGVLGLIFLALGLIEWIVKRARQE